MTTDGLVPEGWTVIAKGMDYQLEMYSHVLQNEGIVNVMQPDPEGLSFGIGNYSARLVVHSQDVERSMSILKAMTNPGGSDGPE